LVNVTPIKIDGQIIGAINAFRDITHEIEIDRMKNEFISLASHQLRTPLSAIKWYSEMLLEGDAGKLDSEQTKFVDNINLSNQRMIELVNTLLNISRIESGRIIIESKLTDLKELISTVIHEFEPKLKEKNQKIIVNINPNLKKVNCDSKLIFEVYKNLISNAIKYSPKEGEIQIFVSSDPKNVISQITDNGYGIPKKDQGKVFDKFYRGGNILKIETEGTGLGLYLVKSIVESSGGKIWFKSEENKGTTFWFSLPLKGVNSKKGEVSINS
jgi:signal transduction histidine kinase